MKAIVPATIIGCLCCSPAAADTVPTDVLSALAAAPALDAVQLPVGQTFYVPSNILKIRNLTLTPGSRVVFPSALAIEGGYYVLAVSKLSVQVPSPTEASALITYVPASPTKVGQSCGVRPDGGRGGVGHDNGYPGGPGGPGANAVPRKPFTIYVIIGALSTSGPNPTSGRFINLTARGADGDSGSDGCEGGRGGDGDDRGSFQGPGDSGKPGPGGVGGAAAAGQDGGSVKFFVSPSLSKEVRFILIDQAGGKAGQPGQGGRCGQTGRAGSGSFWGGGGRGIDCDEPKQAAAGTSAIDGALGTSSITEGNYSSILPLRGGAGSIKAPRAPKKLPFPAPPPPPPAAE